MLTLLGSVTIAVLLLVILKDWLSPLVALIHLDGSGAVCFLIAIPAMLPVYDRSCSSHRSS